MVLDDIGAVPGRRRRKEEEGRGGKNVYLYFPYSPLSFIWASRERKKGERGEGNSITYDTPIFSPRGRARRTWDR